MYASSEIGLLVVFVATNNAVNLDEGFVARREIRIIGAYITFFGCQSITVFLR